MQARPLLAALAFTLITSSLARAQSTDDPASESAGKVTKHRKQHGHGKKHGKKAAAEPAADDAAKPDDAGKAGGIAADPTGDAAAAAPTEAPVPVYDENGEPAGATEDPNAPDDSWEHPVQKVAKAAPVLPTVYPIRLIDRPLVLPHRMTELAIELPLQGVEDLMGNATLHQSGVLRAWFGVTDRVQAGLRYGTGTFTKDGYKVGKTFSLDANILLLHWVAAQVSLPVLVDPYSQGLTLGAPMKFTFFDKLSFVLLNDLVSFKIHRFVPDVADAAFDQASADADAVNQSLPNGELDINGSILYQQADDLAVIGRVGLHYPDFKQQGAPVQLDVGLLYSTSNKVDLGARIGFADMGQTPGTFAANLFAALRL